MPGEFSSERLYFRSLNEDDVTDAYVDWLNDSLVNEFLETRFVIQTKKSVSDFVCTQNTDPISFLWGMFLLKSEKHIGNIKIGPVNVQHRRADVSLFVGDKSCWGQGYAKEAITAVTKYGFEQLELDKIEAGCYENNKASLHAFINVGYKIEGTMREHVLYKGKRVAIHRVGILPGELTENG